MNAREEISAIAAEHGWEVITSCGGVTLLRRSVWVHLRFNAAGAVSKLTISRDGKRIQVLTGKRARVLEELAR